MLKLPKELANQFDDENHRIRGEQESGVHNPYVLLEIRFLKKIGFLDYKPGSSDADWADGLAEGAMPRNLTMCLNREKVFAFSFPFPLIYYSSIIGNGKKCR